ncbi:hypothetical protein PF003_g19468 [Phytophthora fragariae]|nr:hypothetical protein PF003_g19468 [Phytophthora fragariae]
MASCGWPAARFVVVDGVHGVGGIANEGSVLVLHATAASGSVVAASELEHGKLRLASSKVRGRRWRGGVANEGSVLVLHASAAASRLVAASELEHGKLRLASSKVRGRRWRAWRWWRR